MSVQSPDSRHQPVRRAPMRLLLALILVTARSTPADDTPDPTAPPDVFRRENLVAWCIVPFDDRDRTPDERAQMLRELGLTRYAYDYRAKHVPTFEAELEAISRHKIELVGWWFPTTLNDEAQHILDLLEKHKIRTQLWVTGGGDHTSSPDEQQARIVAEAARIRPIAEAAARIGCRVSLYNHGGWFGEPENQIAVIRELDLPNVGIVYNLHHGHAHLDRFDELLATMLPHLDALNLNGMTRDGDRTGHKILPIGAGELDLHLLRSIRDTGYTGPIGILNHTPHNARDRLQDNLDGLDWLTRQLGKGDPGPRPKWRTHTSQ